MWRNLHWPGESGLYYYAACVILIGAAAGLRFHGLASGSLTSDEAIAARNARASSLSQLIDNTRHQNASPALWPLGLWAIQKIESSHTSLRIVPAIASTLTVAAVVLLLPPAGIRRSTALLAGVMLTVSTTAIQAAQHTREYSIDVLLSVMILAGTLWYLKGKKKWMLIVSLFIAPLLHYGLALFGAAILVTMIVVNWIGGNTEQKGGLFRQTWQSFRFIGPPSLSLLLGSIATWDITLRYQGTGFGSEDYLQDAYYMGSPTDIIAIARFTIQGFRNIIDFNVEMFPAIIVIAVTILAFGLCRSFRTNGIMEIMVLFLFGMAIASIAGLMGLYPLHQHASGTPEGEGRLALIWGPVVALIFSQAIMSISSVTSGTISTRSDIIRRYPAAVHMVVPTVFVAVFITGGASDVSKYQNVYRDVFGTKPILEFLDPGMEDGDIVIWHPDHQAGVRYYLNDRLSGLHLFADTEECLNVLGILPDSTKRIWIIQSRSPCGYEMLAHLYDPDLVVSKRFRPSPNPALFLVSDAQRAARYFSRLVENEDDIFSDPSNIVLRTNQYDVSLTDHTILYTTLERCEDVDIHARVILQIFPVEQIDLPDFSRENGFDNLDFHFHDFAVGFGERCHAVRFLPDYPVERIWTGDSGGEIRFIYPGASLRAVDIDTDFLEGLGDPVLEHDAWMIYSAGRHLVFTGACEDDQARHPFFLHFYPVEASDLSEEQREHGFEGRDFYFSTDAGVVGDACVAVREIPDYPLDYIHVGQYVPMGRDGGTEKIWEAVIEGEDAGPPVE